MLFRSAKHTYETHQGMIDVTSMNRPDIHWKKFDKAGHLHLWFYDDKMVNIYDRYNPEVSYQLKTLVRIVDVEGNDEYPPVTHLECPLCGEHIIPGTCADQYQQFIGGLIRCWVDGIPVSKERFEEFAREEGLIP